MKLPSGEERRWELEIKLQSFLDWTYTRVIFSTHHIRYWGNFHLHANRSSHEEKYQFCNFPFQWLLLLYFRFEMRVQIVKWCVFELFARAFLKHSFFSSVKADFGSNSNCWKNSTFIFCIDWLEIFFFYQLNTTWFRSVAHENLFSNSRI